MRVALQPRFRLGNADLGQQFQGPLSRHLAGDRVVELDHLDDLRLDRVQRIERGHRLLEDDRDVVAAQRTDVVLRQRQQFLSLEADAAGGMRGRTY